MKCKVCGKEFIPFQVKSMYCSNECRKIVTLAKAKQKRSERPIPEKTRIVCGKTFYSIKKNVSACSDECKAKRRAELSRSVIKMSWVKPEAEELKKPPKTKHKSHLEEKLKFAAEHNTNYAEIQKAETLRMYGRVEI